MASVGQYTEMQVHMYCASGAELIHELHILVSYSSIHFHFANGQEEEVVDRVQKKRSRRYIVTEHQLSLISAFSRLSHYVNLQRH